MEEDIYKFKYTVERNGESLTARLIEENVRMIVIDYRNVKGDLNIGIYRNGSEVATDAGLVGRKNPLMNSKGWASLPDYLAAYDRLGPELRAQIPSDWHPVLGRWLAPKE